MVGGLVLLVGPRGGRLEPGDAGPGCRVFGFPGLSLGAPGNEVRVTGTGMWPIVIGTTVSIRI